jgi:hypothetical protein
LLDGRAYEKSEIDEAEIRTFRRRVVCAGRLAQGEHSLPILAEEGASTRVIHRSGKSLGIKLGLAESPV